jgi:hypothetical protein
LNITTEGRLQREIKDIIDETDIMIYVVRQQEEVITRFTKLALEILHRSGQSTRAQEGAVIELLVRIQYSDSSWSDIKLKQNGDSEATADTKPIGTAPGKQPVKNGRSSKPQIETFNKRAADLISEMSDRIKELEGLKKSAETKAQNVNSNALSRRRVADSVQVNDLLSVKQQQANVVQAYQAIKQGEETVKQGRAITLFTVMTIVFVA